MLPLTEIEKYSPAMFESLIAAATYKAATFQTKTDYSSMDTNAGVITEPSVALYSFLQYREHNFSGTDQISSEFAESIDYQISKAPVRVETIYSFFKSPMHVEQQQDYNIIFDISSLTVSNESFTNLIKLWSVVKTESPPTDHLSILHDTYEFNYGGDEEQFILRNIHIAPFLIDASAHVSRICGSDVNIKLQYNKDDEEDFETLFIIIQTGLSADQNVTLIDRIDNEWWLSVNYSIRKVLSIDVES